MVGLASNTGSADHNLALADQRVESVVKELARGEVAASEDAVMRKYVFGEVHPFREEVLPDDKMLENWLIDRQREVPCAANESTRTFAAQRVDVFVCGKGTAHPSERQ